MQIRELLSQIPFLSTQGPLSGEVSSIVYDSRQCIPGSLFCAVSGTVQDGHNYITDAIKRGATFIICEREVEAPPGVTIIRVADSRETMGKLGKAFYGDPSSRLCLVGVTGTNGKTTVTYLMESIFIAAGFKTGVLGTVNYRYGGQIFPAPNTTPESLDLHRILHDMVLMGVTHCVAEVSSHALALKRVDECDFDLGIFTNLSRDHLDFHRNMEDYYAAKRRFFTELIPRSRKERAIRMVVNGDDAWGKRLCEESSVPSWTFGIREAEHVRAEDYSLSLQGTRAEIWAPGERLEVFSPLLGMYNLYNILAAVGAAIALEIPPTKIAEGIARVHRIPGRLERVNEVQEPHVFVDYAHTDDALQKVISALLPFKQKKLITVFGCGGDRDRGKRPKMGKVAAENSDIVIVTSDNPRTEDPLEIIAEIVKGISEDVMERVEAQIVGERSKAYTVIPDRRLAIKKAIDIAEEGDIVLIAGKGHEDYQIIGREKIWFDDRVIAKECLKEKYGRGGR
ncbi:MAG: UDP-N-acetylmuramoyl-L-alanyl-D-glutamate--2,6-diaminopimelate ligase [Syntrophales bacterium]|nr:UDP-N-acetylmuramoyl-L-alanyl-D-glutamate--2,6-diaminopimelate ligase [Syntrophales bacterium]